MELAFVIMFIVCIVIVYRMATAKKRLRNKIYFIRACINRGIAAKHEIEALPELVAKYYINMEDYDSIVYFD